MGSTGDFVPPFFCYHYQVPISNNDSVVLVRIIVQYAAYEVQQRNTSFGLSASLLLCLCVILVVFVLKSKHGGRSLILTSLFHVLVVADSWSLSSS